MAVLPYQQDCEIPPPFTVTAAASGAAADDHQPRMMVKPMFAVTSLILTRDNGCAEEGRVASAFYRCGFTLCGEKKVNLVFTYFNDSMHQMLRGKRSDSLIKTAGQVTTHSQREKGSMIYGSTKQGTTNL
jgi:hypothetical protein